MIISRVASVVVAVVYLAAAYFSFDDGALALLKATGALILPLALIWFPDVFGDYLGPSNPAVLVAFMGWLLLVGLPLVAYLLWRFSTLAQ
jgi:hypothetical protein